VLIPRIKVAQGMRNRKTNPARMLVRIVSPTVLALCLCHATPTLSQDFDPVAYLKAVDNPKPSSSVEPKYRDAAGWASVLTGASRIAFCEVQQDVLSGELAFDPVRNREFARVMLRALLRGQLANETAHREDLMLDFAKTYCQKNGCDCAETLKSLHEFNNNYGSGY
jgi:hypothetical protein